MAYATYANVTARLGWTISSSGTKPTESQITDEIALIEDDLDGEPDAAGFTAPVTDADGITYLRQCVVAEACARALELRGTVTDEEQGSLAEQIDRFRAKWTELVGRDGDIARRPSVVAVKIGQAFGSTAGSAQIRSYVTDNSDGLSISGGDFDPVITRTKKW